MYIYLLVYLLLTNYYGSGKVGSHDRRAKKVGSPDKKVKENVSSAKNPLILDPEVLRGLNIPCFWLHECIRDLVDDSALDVVLEAQQFHYIEELSTFIAKVDIKNY